jgi:hypothetical protein
VASGQWSVGCLSAANCTFWLTIASAFVCCGVGIAAEPGEPATFTADVTARPINDSEISTSSALRWKAKPRPTASDYFASDEAAQPVAQSAQRPLRAGWNITRIDPSVRQAQYVGSAQYVSPAQHASSDPFNDPFGDRKANHNSEPSLILQPTQAEANIEELPPPRTLSPVRRAAPRVPALTAAQPGGNQPPGRSRGELPDANPALSPPGASSSDRATLPCDRVYNDRNCCDLETNCHDFRNRLLSDSIRNISLDITPRYNPDLTQEEDESDRADKLRLLELRQWRNRRGAIIATGKMVNLRNGAVVLADENGREVSSIHTSELGEDELCYVTAWWRLPSECPLGGLRTMERNWIATTYPYHASALCHKPLYFEEVQLERYGHTAGPFRQPIISGAHFIISLTALPYQMAISPPTECEYSLGYYRPGNCAPWMIPPIPLSVRGAAAEVAAAVGMFYMFP